MHIRKTRLGGEILALAVVYFITARFSLLLAIPPGYATPIWPAAGIALAAVLLLGNRVAPGVWLGSFLANAASAFAADGAASLADWLLVPTGLGIASTIQALGAALLIRRLVGFPTPLERAGDVVRFLALGGPIGCVVGASIGVTTLVLAGRLPEESFGFHWWAWWIGDAIGVLVATPLILTWFGEPHVIWRRRRKTLALPVLVTFAVILGVFTAGQGPLFSPPQTWIAWFVLAAGMAFTGLLGAFLLAVSGHAMVCEQLVLERTRALERTRRAEQVALQLSAIVTSSDDAIIGKTLDGTIVSWNAGAERMYGYLASEMIGHSIQRLIPPELTDEYWGILKRVGQGEQVEHLETVRLHKDGRRLDVSLTISPIHDAAGVVTGASTIARDITGRKRAEDALRDKESRIQRLMDANIIGVFIGDLTGHISEANDAFLKICGYSRDEVLAGQFRWSDITPPEYRAADKRARN